jgi:Ca2+-binding EF-hand superfamily protein
MLRNASEPKAVNLNSTTSEFQSIDQNNDGVVSKKEFEKVKTNQHNYAYDEPITITLIICGITLLSCAFSGAFKKK